MSRVVEIYLLVPRILSLSSSIRCVISFTPQPHYTWERVIGQESGWDYEVVYVPNCKTSHWRRL
jgi:hypothetical protein